MRRRLLTVIAFAAIVGSGISACGSSTSDPGGSTPVAASVDACDVTVSVDTATKPTITIPECAKKPSALVTRDVVAGSGPVAAAGDAVTVKYVGVSWSTKQQFDASWDNGLGQFTVAPLGSAGVINGWNQGLIGVRKGTRRLLVIPPALGYGAQGNGPIGPNETLVFVVDVVSINSH